MYVKVTVLGVMGVDVSSNCELSHQFRLYHVEYCTLRVKIKWKGRGGVERVLDTG